MSDGPIEFGTDGIRGRAGETPCTPEVGVAIGRAVVRLARELGAPRPRVMVARDTRESGPMLEAAVAAGVAGQGGECLLAGVLPTSGLATALGAGLGDVGVMLTASHNPAPDNGFKVLGPRGRKLTDEENALVERFLTEPPAACAPGEIQSAQDEAWDAYAEGLCSVLPERSTLRGKRIAVDLANGAAVPVRDWLMSEVPADWVFVGAGTGLPNDGVGSEHPERLQQTVRDEGCVAGFAVDGDGDRCRLVDEHGRVVDGDALAWLLARGRGVGALAVTVMSTTALEASLPGVQIIRTPVGDRHLAEAMKTQGAALGCEESGHVLFADALPTGDGIVTGIRALALGLRDGGLAQAVSDFRPFPRVVTKVPVRERPPLEEVDLLQQARRGGEGELGEGGRVFLRYSGTEPLLRVLVEGRERAAVERVSAEVTRIAREALS